MRIKKVDIEDIGAIVANQLFRYGEPLVPKLLRDIENEIILNMMVLVKGNKSDASRRLGISRMALIYKLKVLGYKYDGSEEIEKIQDYDGETNKEQTGEEGNHNSE